MASVTLVMMAEALFASTLQPSDRPTAAQARVAIAAALHSHGGAPGCAARLAAEYGKQPEVAAARMQWALALVAAA